MRVASLLVLAVLVVGCASVKPIPISAGDVCFHCRRTITDPSLAAEIISNEGHAFKFSSVVCVTEYLRDHPNEGVRAVFVADHARNRLMEAEGAYYVPFKTPPPYTGTEFAAFRDLEKAKEFASLNHAAPTDWDGVVAAKMEHVGH